MARIEVDFDQSFKTLLGKDMLKGEDEQPFKIGDMIAGTLAQTWEGDKRNSQQKLSDHKLALKLIDDEDSYNVVSLSDKQRKHLKDVAFDTVPSATLYAQIVAALGYEDDEIEEEETP